ncbi:hypothetical protein [Mesorhizobium sp. L48C026A00]|uniref:hypothetical protein n=1 Tax=Mesorhizobium sp. L48C026A00 TaxID=1287182 RepID=UPI0003F9D95E|nr:hypothetical protein [Mesorhizobium sp. L48C026A00]
MSTARARLSLGSARFVSHWDITRLPYDGPADRWFVARLPEITATNEGSARFDLGNI